MKIKLDILKSVGFNTKGFGSRSQVSIGLPEKKNPVPPFFQQGNHREQMNRGSSFLKLNKKNIFLACHFLLISETRPIMINIFGIVSIGLD